LLNKTIKKDITLNPDKEKTMKQTCSWATNDPLLTEYHDNEWGVPIHDDGKIFEFLVLEGFQAGLSWLTILKKRENFRKAFDDFDFAKIARYDVRKLNALLKDAGIIRNRLKIIGSIENAKAFIQVRKEFGTFDEYIWGFTDGKIIVNKFTSPSQIPAHTSLSDTISKDLKKRGFKFVGSTIMYSHMQAMGIVNDHIQSCFRYKELVSNSNSGDKMLNF
jgi:DNA-3-methyladenine glycosylase I